MISGSIVALVTPMAADGSVDWAALERLVEVHVADGTDGIVAVGTTGESATLTVAEHEEVIRFTVEKVAGRLSVLAGTGANSTAEAIELSLSAEKAGADACLSVTPYYNKPTQEGLFLHYSAIADAVGIPQILYNVPGRTACDLLPETTIRLSFHDNIIGTKEATGIVERAPEILAQCAPGFAVYSGDDATALELIRLGAKGNISVTANVAPRLMAELCRCAMAGDFARAEAINEQLAPLNSVLFLEANPIPVKWALQTMGLIDEGIRLPLTPLSEPFREQVRDALGKAGIL